MTTDQKARKVDVLGVHGNPVQAEEASETGSGIIYRVLLFSLILSAISSILAIIVAIKTREETKAEDKKKEQSEKNIRKELQELQKEIALLKGDCRSPL